MRRFTAIALLTSASLFAHTVVVADRADAAPAQDSAQSQSGTSLGQLAASVDEAGTGRATLTFQDPLAAGGILRTRLDTHVYLGDAPAFTDTPTATSRTEGNVKVVELRNVDKQTGIEMVRTYRFDGARATLETTMKNTTSQTQALQLDLTHAGVYSSTAFEASEGVQPIVARTTNPEYDITVEFGGNPQATGFSGGNGTWADAKYGEDGTKAKAGEDGSRLQGGRWFRPLKPGETFSGSITVSAKAAAKAIDRDSDGIPDEWERTSFTPAGTNEKLDLARWGASPDKPDLFLQLNWMEPEAATTGCSDEPYTRDVEGFSDYLSCASANKNEYRPSRKALNDLVELFAKEGYNLHIDAGAWYNNFTTDRAQFKGGPTESYEQYYAENGKVQQQLDADRGRLLGGRKSVFRLGIIGDRISPDDDSSGAGSTPGGAFFVSKPEAMTNDEQLRNTILHELGHNIGLSHTGAARIADPAGQNYLPNYVSTMNYLYQFSHFGFTKEESRSGGPLPEICTGKPCFTGSYTVPADWKSLQFNDGVIGRATGSVAPESSPNSHAPSVPELEKYAADKNNGKGGFRLVDTPKRPNGVATHRSDNVLTGEISNLGRDAHRFTLEARYANGKTWRETFAVDGIPLDDASTVSPKRTVQIPVNLPADYRGSSLPVSFRLVNEAGEEQYNETLTVPVLDYSAAEAAAVLKKVLADGSVPAQQKILARSVLTPIAEGAAVPGEDRAPSNGGDDRSPSVDETGQNQSQRAKTAGSSSTAGLVFAVVALIAAIAGLVGLVALPNMQR